jgi:hypothetical protein
MENNEITATFTTTQTQYPKTYKTEKAALADIRRKGYSNPVGDKATNARGWTVQAPASVLAQL